jgi:hypothetical protein
MAIRMVFTDETDKTLIDCNGSQWSFGDLWQGFPNVRKILLNGKEYKPSKGNCHRGWLMMLGDDGYVSILHARRKDGALQLGEEDICHMCEPGEAMKWNDGWKCDWRDTPDWVRMTVNARYGM